MADAEPEGEAALLTKRKRPDQCAAHFGDRRCSAAITGRNDTGARTVERRQPYHLTGHTPFLFHD